MNSIGEVFGVPHTAHGLAALIRCKHDGNAQNRIWLSQNKTGIWRRSSREGELKSIIVLIDAADVVISGVVEVWVGRVNQFEPYEGNAAVGFYHVDAFELVGLTKTPGLSQFCKGYCEGPNSGLVYLDPQADLPTAEVRSTQESEDFFRPEFSGAKDVSHPGNYTADCLHGRVVTALYRQLKDENPLRRFSNRNRVDLLMHEPDGSRTLFEVKTAYDSQSVFTGVGQLMIYNLQAGAHHKVLVLPSDSTHWRARLEDVQTTLWTYENEGKAFQRA